MQDEAEELHDAASVFGLTKRDLVRPSNTFKLDELSARQMGFVLSGSSSLFSANDIFETGGEMEPRYAFSYKMIPWLNFETSC